jgi:LPS O-antigen subunit length determinant protein (WzzB/FepE family)
MSEVRPTYDDELDLVELAQTVWDGRWKIVAVVALSVLSVFGYQTIQSQPNFEALTEIKPITSVEAERYRQSNALGFFEVTPNTLLNLYIEQLDERTLFEEAIHKYQLLDIENFEDKQAYDEAVIALASSIEILPPINVDGTEREDVKRFWTIGFEYNDDAKWKQVLLSVDSLANQSVQRILQQRFRTSLSVAKQKQIFKLEDLDLLITNALEDYERTTSDRLAYLSEQASIARKLGVAKNTIEAQTFSAQNGMIANVETKTPFYLRGYEAIEKEIELIKSRTKKEAFVSGLLELEQKQRTLKQDKTLERADILFASTPIMSTNDFSDVSVTVDATEIEDKSKKMLMLALSVVIGGMVGVFYVFFSSAVRKRKEVSSKE